MLARVPLRLRVTAAFAVVITVVLAATGGFVYLRLAHELDATIEQSLRSRAGDVGALVGRGGLADSDLVEREENLAQVLGPDGRVVEATPAVRGQPLLTPREVAAARSGTTTVDRDTVRLLATPVRGSVVVVGAQLEDRDETLASLLRLLLLGGSAAILLASLAGYWVTGRALAPVEAMRRRAAAIDDPAERLPVPPADDELSRLGVTINDMLERLDAALARERTLVADASHELRTPLSILRTELELALRRPRTIEELERTVRGAAEQTDHLIRLAEDLLVLARSDQGRLPIRPERVAVAELFARFPTVAATDPGELTVMADPLRLEQAVGNLVDNALRHGAHEVELAAETDEGMVELHVRDDGPGFPETFLDSAFERFSRADAGRTGGGAGLGLAIADAIARAHGGSAGAANRPEGGADVWLRLPYSSSPSPSMTTRS